MLQRVHAFSSTTYTLVLFNMIWKRVCKPLTHAQILTHTNNMTGKTTTINMLTGFLPPTSGNALVYGHTVASPNGMAHVKRLMGVCPQFDILWDNLSAKQHLELFGAIRGISAASLGAEADKRLEEVRLTEVSNQVCVYDFVMVFSADVCVGITRRCLNVCAYS